MLMYTSHGQSFVSIESGHMCLPHVIHKLTGIRYQDKQKDEYQGNQEPHL